MTRGGTGTTALIRPARPSDAEAIARVHVDSWQAAYLGIIPAPVLNAMNVGGLAEGYHRSLRREPQGHSRTLVAAVDGEVLGFTSLGPTRDPDDNPHFIGEIYALYLTPIVWGKGLGFELFKAAQDHLQAQLFAAATVWVLRQNTRARRFYEMAGFQRDRGARDAVLGQVRLPEVRYRARL
ncbi:MAG: GNAT family N-acetyltransferase [Byssovorax sp.]